MNIITKRISLFFILISLLQSRAGTYSWLIKADSLNINQFNQKDSVKSNDEITVETVYQNYLKFIDPTGTLPTINSVSETSVYRSTMEVEANNSKIESNFVMLNFRTIDGKVVSVTKMPTIETKVVFDGKSGYTELSNGTKTKFTKSVLDIYNKSFGNNVLFAEQKPIENANVKETVFEDIKVYVVTYEENNASIETESHTFYDMSTFKKVGAQIITNYSGTKTITTLIYEDYTDFYGILQPKRIKTNTVVKHDKYPSTTNSIAEIDYKFNESFEQYSNESLDNISSNLASIPKSKSKNSSTDIFKSSNTVLNSLGSDANNNTSATDNSEEIAKSLANIDNLSESEEFNKLNAREQAYQLVLKKKAELGNTTSNSFSENNAATVQSSGEVERIDKMDASVAGKLKYRRSSLYTLMLDDNTREHNNVIKDAFGNTELSEKFNDHNIGPYLIPANGSGGEKDQTQLIEDYLNNKGVARSIVAKWFNRDDKGNFNMNLIAKRGQYNASEIDLKIAQSSIRGKALLSDAGRELIGNTFIIVYDYKYTNKEEQAKKRGGFLNTLSSVASIVPGGDNVSTISSAAKLGSDVVGKGYFVRTTSYLYRLVWNDEIAQEFYQNLWIDQESHDETKREAFDKSDLFKLEYIGNEISRNNLQSTIFSSKSNEQLIEIATTKAVDKNIGKLQRTFEEFRVKTPLLSIDPIAAKIGLKEDIEKNDKFEVLEQVLNEDGTTQYERVGIIKVDGSKIWDNTYLSEETNQNQDLNYTIFKGSSKNIAPGMLIRQIN